MTALALLVLTVLWTPFALLLSQVTGHGCQQTGCLWLCWPAVL
jgi:hypothetical protein